MVRGIKRPTSDVEDVEKTHTMPERNTVHHADLEDPAELEDTAGKIRKFQDIG
ncbi:MAG: hypothetical protein Kow0019_17390 [Methanobacteriaceae archaeon]